MKLYYRSQMGSIYKTEQNTQGRIIRTLIEYVGATQRAQVLAGSLH